MQSSAEVEDFLILTVCAAVFGTIMSFYTGKTHELPKWNGWSYLLFSAKEFAMMGAIVTCPIAVIIALVMVMAFSGRATR